MDDQIEVMKIRLGSARHYLGTITDAYNKKCDDLADQLSAIRDIWEKTHTTLLSEHSAAQEELAHADIQLRTALIERYNATKEKKYDDDLSVRITSKFQYENADAVEWAEKNAPILVVKSVDKKAFESLPQIEKLEFVYRHDTVTAVIAKDL